MGLKPNAITPGQINKWNVIPWLEVAKWEPETAKYPKCDKTVQRAVQAYDDKLKIQWMPATVKNIAMFGEPEDGHIFAGDGAEMWKFKPTKEFPFTIVNKTVGGGAWGLFRECVTDHGKKHLYVGWMPIPDAYLHADRILLHLRHTDLQRQDLSQPAAQQRLDAQWNARTENAAKMKAETKAEVYDDRKIIGRGLASAFGSKPHVPTGYGSHASAKPKLVNEFGHSL